MKGATTEPWVKTNNAPIRTIVIINGASQYFFLILRKSHISLNKSKSASIIKNTIKKSVFLQVISSIWTDSGKSEMLLDAA